MNHSRFTQTYLTSDTPGIGGVIKQRPADFIVEEIPAYDACGQGEHLFLYIEKQKWTTTDALHRLAKLFGVRAGDVGYAGLKDKQAVTRQHFSVRLPDPSEDEKLTERIAFTGMQLLWARRHTNKLRRGHLKGNRFTLKVRNFDASAVGRARDVIDRLQRRGVPNFIGEQRFGARFNNHVIGRHMILAEYALALDELLGHAMEGEGQHYLDARAAYDAKDYAKALEHWPRHAHHERAALDMLRQGRTPEQVFFAMRDPQRDFFISALQSSIFNAVLDRRLQSGHFDSLVEGDLAFKHDSGAVFLVDQATADLENAPAGRVPAMGLSPSGPVWGARMALPQHKPLEWEEQALKEAGLSAGDFQGKSIVHMEGSRRPLRTILSNASTSLGDDVDGPYFEVKFDLPRGSYATVALREIIKPQSTGTAMSEDVEENDERGR